MPLFTGKFLAPFVLPFQEMRAKVKHSILKHFATVSSDANHPGNA